MTQNDPRWFVPGRAAAQPLQYATPARATEHAGIGGWLILPLIGLFVRPLIILAALANLLPLFTNPAAWARLTVPGNAAYHPLWKPLLLFELLANGLFIAFDVILLVLFFQKRRVVPALMIAFMLTTLVFLIIDHVLAQQIPFVARRSSPEGTMQIVRALAVCAVWVPYFLVSKRVKATFVR